MYLGCSCDLGGAVSRECDAETGQCDCKSGVTGRDCDRPDSGYYIPALYHIKSNVVLKDSISGFNVSINVVLKDSISGFNVSIKVSVFT